MQKRLEPQALGFFDPSNPFAHLMNAFRLPMGGPMSMPPHVAEMTRKLEPVTQAASRAQLETLSLVARQARAAFDLPSRLAACRTPQDFASTQVQFWQTAVEQQTEGVQRIMAAWSGLLVGVAPQAAKAPPQPVKRDILAFPEQPATPATAPVAGKVDPTTPRFAAE